jgi:hypothetical protein
MSDMIHEAASHTLKSEILAQVATPAPQNGAPTEAAQADTSGNDLLAAPSTSLRGCVHAVHGRASREWIQSELF